MIKRISLTLLVCMSVYTTQAQSIGMDTTLTYSTFLNQCVDFKSKAKQEIWVVHFWASWNSASLAIIDDLVTVHAIYQNKPVRFVGVSVDKSRDAWAQRLNQYPMPWEQLFLPSQDDYDFLRRAFKHNSIPAIFLVNTDGQIQRLHDNNELMEMLAALTPALPNKPYVLATTPPVKVQPAATPAPSAGTRTQQPTAGANSYTVLSGDTLYSISRKLGVNVDQLKKVNGLKDNNIRVGQQLKIP